LRTRFLALPRERRPVWLKRFPEWPMRFPEWMQAPMERTHCPAQRRESGALRVPVPVLWPRFLKPVRRLQAREPQWPRRVRMQVCCLAPELPVWLQPRASCLFPF
jgi:hypothetical protein